MAKSSVFPRQLLAKKIGRGAVYLALLGSLGVVTPAYSSTILGTLSANAGLLTIGPSPESTLSALIAVGPLPSNCFVIGNCPQIALLQGINSSAIGTTVTLNSGVPAFAGVVSVLTNGSLDYVSGGVVPGPSFGTSSGGAIGTPETAFGTQPDFAGHTIGSIVLRVDDVQIGAGSGGTVFNLLYTINVYGADTSVPEPSTWLTVTAGGFALIWRRRKLHQRRG